MKTILNIKPVTPVFGMNAPVKTSAPSYVQDSFSLLDKYCQGFKKEFLLDLRAYFASSKKLKESDIKGVLGYGGLSVVFDLGEKGALKCSLENPLEYRKHNPAFDIPFLAPVEKRNKTYIVHTVKADTKNVTIEDCKDVIRRIKESGFELSRDLDEYKVNQVGIFEGKSYLLDSRCAMPCPNAFSRFVYDFCNTHRRVFKAQPIYSLEEECKLVEKFGPQVLHIDETPRKNLGFIEGVSNMLGIIRENIKYG